MSEIDVMYEADELPCLGSCRVEGAVVGVVAGLRLLAAETSRTSLVIRAAVDELQLCAAMLNPPRRRAQWKEERGIRGRRS